MIVPRYTSGNASPTSESSVTLLLCSFPSLILPILPRISPKSPHNPALPFDYSCVLSDLGSADSVQDGPSVATLAALGAGWAAGGLGTSWRQTVKITSCEIAAEWGAEGFAQGIRESENMEIYSSCCFLRGHGLWNASEMPMSSL